ncbi:GNAT family N-acetyltransferase [Nocardioides sp. WS12]|uniref:GNAT family N-acetyltransferase n=1 Tax=Nocardioides sp. WS12 TaxID=2486272 RepID=UPI0015FAEAF0|nr:GNAT family N-acetyltransferase [Nocardioides sp. WS12]
MSSEYDVWFTDDASAFLARAGEHLAQDPVTGTVVSTTAQRFADTGAPEDLPYGWFVVVSGPTGEIDGVAMRTAPFPPYPLYLLAMSDAGAEALGHALVARSEDTGEEIGGINGLRPASDIVAGIVAAHAGNEVQVSMHSRLHELGTLSAARPVAGSLRPVRADEAELALAWIREFFLDANEQAGRDRNDGHHADHFSRADIEQKLADDVLRFWVDEDDRPVHLTGWNPPAYEVARVGPVFTPKEQRGKGLASAAVAQVSAELQEAGNRVILFTDQANPTSNAIYQALGYEAVADTIELRLA